MGPSAIATQSEELPQERRTWRAADGSEVDAAAAVVAFQAGDGRALETLMQCFSLMMSHVARRYLRSRQDVEDAVQDAWVAFTRNAHLIESPRAIGAWLRVTTAHAAIVIAKRQARCVPTDLPVDTGLPTAEPHDGNFPDTAMHAVRDALSRLGGRDRELIAMLFESDLSYREIVARTGRPVGSIGPTRQRVMVKLRRDRSIHRLATLRAS